MTFKQRVRKFHTKQKESFSSFKNMPSVGEKVLGVGKKIERLPKSPRFKKIRKKGIALRGNIDYYFQN